MVLDVAAGSLGSVVDLGGRVVNVAAGGGVASLEELGGSSADDGDEGEEEGGDLHVGGCDGGGERDGDDGYIGQRLKKKRGQDSVERRECGSILSCKVLVL